MGQRIRQYNDLDCWKHIMKARAVGLARWWVVPRKVRGSVEYGYEDTEICSLAQQPGGSK